MKIKMFTLLNIGKADGLPYAAISKNTKIQYHYNVVQMLNPRLLSDVTNGASKHALTGEASIPFPIPVSKQALTLQKS